jgi:hypothetical protein
LLGRPPSITRFSVGKRAVLFCEARQQLFELNETADALWTRLAAGGRLDDLRNRLVAQRQDRAQAEQEIHGLVSGWLASGHLWPASALERLTEPPDRVLTFAIGDAEVEIRLSGRSERSTVDICNELMAAFGQFKTSLTPDPTVFDIVEDGDVNYIAGPGAVGLPMGGEELAPELKAIFTRLYLSAGHDGFLVHGALLSHRNRGLVLCAPPGGGKTTLAVTLTRQGFRFQTDDIIQVGPRGEMTGVPFAAAVKSGSWPLVAAVAPELELCPRRRRSDGQWVKYLRLDDGHAKEPLSARWIIFLDRKGTSAPGLFEIDALSAVTEILGSAYSRQGRIETDTLAGLVTAAQQAVCYRLSYESLDDALAQIRAVTNE